MKRIFKVSLKIAFGLIAVIVIIAVVGIGYQEYWNWSDKSNFEPKGKFININGRNVHYVKSGENSPAVIFEPGVQFWSTSWKIIQDEVSKQVTTYSYDRGGMGFSDQIECINEETYVNDLYTFIEKLNIAPPILLVVHSFGGIIINAFYNQYPDRVDGIILIEPGNPEDVLQWAPEMTSLHIKLAEWSAKIGLVRFFYRNKLNNENYDKQTIEEFKYVFAKPEVTRSFAQSLKVLRGLTLKSNIDSYDKIPIEIIYTSNFDEVGTSFETEQEREQWKIKYLSFWRELSAKSENSKGIYLIPNANHNSVILNQNYALKAAGRIVDMAKHLKIDNDSLTIAKNEYAK